MSGVEWTHEDVDPQYCGEAEDLEYEKIKHCTDKAVLFRMEKSDVWIPKSMIEGIDVDTVSVAKWFCEKEDLI